MVHLALGAAAFDASGERGGIDANTFMPERSTTRPSSQCPDRAAVPTASHGQRQHMLAGKVDRCNHIGFIFASGDQGGSFVDHAVVDPKSLLIPSIARTKQRTTQA